MRVKDAIHIQACQRRRRQCTHAHLPLSLSHPFILSFFILLSPCLSLLLSPKNCSKLFRWPIFFFFCSSLYLLFARRRRRHFFVFFTSTTFDPILYAQTGGVADVRPFVAWYTLSLDIHDERRRECEQCTNRSWPRFFNNECQITAYRHPMM